MKLPRSSKLCKYFYQAVRIIRQILSSFQVIYLLSFVSYTPNSLNGTQPYRPRARKWGSLSAIWKNVWPKSGVYPPPKSRAQTHIFSTTLQLNGDFNGLYLPNETTLYIIGKCLETTRGLLHRLKMSRTSAHKRLKIAPLFLTFVNYVFHFISRLRRQRSANGTQSNFAKRWSVNRANNLPFRRLWDLMVHIFGTKHDIDNRKGVRK